MEEFKVSPRTITRDAKFAEEVDILAELGEGECKPCLWAICWLRRAVEHPGREPIFKEKYDEDHDNDVHHHVSSHGSLVDVTADSLPDVSVRVEGCVGRANDVLHEWYCTLSRAACEQSMFKYTMRFYRWGLDLELSE